MKDLLVREYRSIFTIKGPLIFLKDVSGAFLGDFVEIELDDELKYGQVIELSESFTVVQVFGTTGKISPGSTRVRFREEVVKIDLSPTMLGRIFSGGGKAIDGGEPIAPRVRRDVHGACVNPFRREPPRDFIQTGISVIDGMNTLVRGQKLPIFSGAGLPANEIVSQIIKNARVADKDEKFAIVFAGMGLTSREADFFIDSFRFSGALEHSVIFLNKADDAVIENLLTPRFALTTAEYFAFELGMQVLVILSDITHYCNALREVASSKDEVPGRRGYPGYMYTDLAGIYERAGRIKSLPGSITQLPILTMPDDDITHPIPDLTGYITEGQIVIDRALHRKGVFPPINVLPSLSRLMGKGIGAGRTREDHRQLSDQIYMCYAKGVEQRSVAAVIGEDGLTEIDRLYMKFADEFESGFIDQGIIDRGIIQTLEIGWRLLSIFPSSELVRINREIIEKYKNGKNNE